MLPVIQTRNLTLPLHFTLPLLEKEVNVVMFYVYHQPSNVDKMLTITSNKPSRRKCPTCVSCLVLMYILISLFLAVGRAVAGEIKASVRGGSVFVRAAQTNCLNIADNFSYFQTRLSPLTATNTFSVE